MRPVSFSEFALKQHGKTLKWTAAILVFFLGCAILLSILRKDPLAQEVEALRVNAGFLESRLRDLEARPIPALGSGNAVTVLKQLSARAHELGDRVRKESGIPDKDKALVSLRSLEAVPKQAEAVIGTARKPAPGSGQMAADARQLLTELLDAERIGDELVARLQGNPRLLGAAEPAVEGLRANIASARSLLPKPVSAINEGDLQKQMTEIATALKRAREVFATIPDIQVKPPAPWPAEDATLVITATADLAETLILPILEAASGGKTYAEENQEWYYTTPPGVKPAEKILVRATEAEPYAAIMEGKSDLVVTNQVASPEDKKAFQLQFPGADLDSRSQSEVVALDGLVLLGNPDAESVILSPRDIQATNWLSGPAGSPEFTAAGRLGFRLAPHENLDGALTASPAARGIQLHHKAANLRAKRLAYQASPETQALVATPFTIATEDYKFALRIVATHSPRSRERAQMLVSFMTSDAGQMVITKNHYVGIGLHIPTTPVDPLRMSVLASALNVKKIKGAERLSTGLRFPTNKDKLDIRALAALERVPDEIDKNFPKSKVVILGFTDNVGNDAYNQDLSVRRAQGVASLVGRGMDVKWAGMGKQLPVDTNDSDEGKSANRRAEIWAVFVD